MMYQVTNESNMYYGGIRNFWGLIEVGMDSFRLPDWFSFAICEEAHI